MKRLTVLLPGGYGLPEGKRLGTATNNRAVINRLGAYEDIGMEPEEIVEVLKKVNGGKFIPVEAMIGETVWVVDHQLTITPYEIIHITCFDKENRTYYCKGAVGLYAFDEEEFGDCVFHSAEKAKAVVKAMQGV